MRGRKADERWVGRGHQWHGLRRWQLPAAGGMRRVWRAVVGFGGTPRAFKRRKPYATGRSEFPPSREFGWQWRFESQLAVGFGGDGEVRRMEGMAREEQSLSEGRRPSGFDVIKVRGGAFRAVKFIADERMAGVGEVDADLVGAAGYGSGHDESTADGFSGRYGFSEAVGDDDFGATGRSLWVRGLH